MFKALLGILLSIFLVMIIGSIMLEEFPSLQPLFEEFKVHIINLYNISLVKYGTAVTLIIIIAIAFIFSGKSK